MHVVGLKVHPAGNIRIVQEEDNMESRVKTEFTRPYSKAFYEWELTNVSLLLPRLWMILIVFFPPFFVIVADYFERLERSGTFGAIIADTMLPAMLVSYVVLVCVLKQRSI